ncbi:hypothetical protein EDB80DRAFT_685306 [Ilyonectria destructans]|nr:hypothetical protein EDB80DRAFT_685306 [Ilyonectria destructans]
MGQDGPRWGGGNLVRSLRFTLKSDGRRRMANGWQWRMGINEENKEGREGRRTHANPCNTRIHPDRAQCVDERVRERARESADWVGGERCSVVLYPPAYNAVAGGTPWDAVGEVLEGGGRSRAPLGKRRCSSSVDASGGRPESRSAIITETGPAAGYRTLPLWPRLSQDPALTPPELDGQTIDIRSASLTPPQASSRTFKPPQALSSPLKPPGYPPKRPAMPLAGSDAAGLPSL